MSLKVTNTRIVIENSSGQEMFDSDQKLIHRKFTQTSSSAVSLGNGYNSTVTYSLNTTLGEKDFALVFVTPTNGDGNVLDDVLNSTVQLNFPMMANFRHSTTDTRITHYEVWSSAISGSALYSLTPKLTFSYFGHYMGANSTGPRGRVFPKPATNSYVTFTWKVVILSYQ